MNRLLLIIMVGLFVTTIIHAASVTFPKIYPGTLNNNKLSITIPVGSTSYTFISANPALPAFSGNNIGGTLNFTLNGQSTTINGWINLRVGNTDGVIFEETTVLGGTTITGRLWLLVYPASLAAFTDNQTLINSNSAGVGSSMDALRVVQDGFVNPVITSDGGGATATISISENTTTATTVTGTVYPASTKTFSITGGVDASKFTINSSTGVLTFVTAPDYENPTDAGLNNVYDVHVTLTDTQGTTDMQAIAVIITNTNDNAPVIISNGGGATASVSVVAGLSSVTTVKATDADYGDVLTYSISGGTHSNLFNIDPSSGALTFKTGAVVGSYQVSVTATDATGNSDTQILTVNVTLIDTMAPSVVITSSDMNLSAGEVCTIRFQFSELVQGFTLSDVAYTGGVLSSLTQSSTDPTLYTATFTQSGTVAAPTFNIAANTYQDLASPTPNNGNAAPQLTLTADWTAPTVVVTFASPEIAYGETDLVTFTFSENPGSSFNLSDVTATNATLASLIQTADPKVWTATIQQTSAVLAPVVTVQNLSYTDLAGNLGSSGTATIPVVPPSIDLANTPISDTGYSSTDNITSNRKPVVEGYVDNATLTVTVQVQYYVSGALTTLTYNSVPVNGATRTYSLDLSTTTPTTGVMPTVGLPEGYVTLVVTTPTGGTASSVFLIDLTAPNPIPEVDNKNTFDQSPSLTGTATVLDGEALKVAVNGITYTNGDGYLSLNGTIWTLNVPITNKISAGAHSVTATVTDAAGNISTDITSNELVINASTITIDLKNAAIDDTGTSFTDNLTANREPTITGTSSGADASVKVTVVSAGFTYTYNSVAVSGGTYSLNLSTTTPSSIVPTGSFPSEGLPDGIVQLSVEGNTSGAVGTNSFVIDATAPAAPTVNSQSTWDTTPTITGTGTFITGDILKVTINGVIYTSGDGNLTYNSVAGTWSLIIPTGNALSVAAYPTTATVTDASGNVSTTGSGTTTIILTTVTVDLANTPGSDTGISSTDNLTSNRKPVINGTASNDAVVTVTLTSVATTYTYNNVTVSAENWTLDLSTASTTSGIAFPVAGLTTGTWTLGVTGNTTATTGTNSFIEDYTAPTTPTVNFLSTTDTTPTITGTATVSEGDLFTVNVNGLTYTNGDGHLTYSIGTWTLNIPTGNEIPINTYTVLATVTDPAGNTSNNTSTNQLVISGIIADVQTYNITPNPTFTTADISWSNGNMSSRVVFMKEGAGTISNPVNSTTYTSNTNWTIKGTQLATSGYYCIYNGTGSSVKVTGLYPGRTYTIQAFEYNGSAGSESYLINVSGANNPITVVPWPTTTFTNSPGVTSKEAWNTAARWDHDTIPSSALHEAVLVYIDGNCEVTSAAECYNLTIKAAHSSISPKLTISPSKSMNVLGGPLGGQLINNGGTSALIIQSSSSAPNGSLIYASGSPSATVEMYSKASWNLGAAVNNKYYWQFFGIPVKTLAYSSTFGSNCFVREWDETVNDYDFLWVRRNNGSSLTLGAGSTLSVNKGYELVQATPTTYSFAGELFNTDFTQSLPYTTDAVYPGQHIFGNPYPAAVDIEKIQFNSNAEEAIYQYNTGTYNQWLNNSGEISPDFSLNTSPGQYTVSTPLTAGSLGVLRQIPSMQGFLVKAMNNNNASFTIPFNSQIINSSQQRAPQLISASDNRVATRIDIRSNHYADRMWIFTDATCNRNYDKGWDGRKIFGMPKATQLFGAETDGNYQINAVKDMNGSYLGFKPGEDMDFVITVTHRNINDRYSAVYLMDLVENKTIDVTASGTSYTFTAIANTPASNRFKIVTQRMVPDSVKSMLKVYNTDEAIFIQNLSSDSGTLTLYNLSGVPVSSIEFIPSGVSTMPTSGLLSGAYLINAFTDNESAKAKIIIR